MQPSLYLKRVLPNAGLAMFAKTGHTVNIEEPDAFNREVWNFLALVEAGKWTPATAGRMARGPDPPERFARSFWRRDPAAHDAQPRGGGPRARTAALTVTA